MSNFHLSKDIFKRENEKIIHRIRKEKYETAIDKDRTSKIYKAPLYVNKREKNYSSF